MGKRGQQPANKLQPIGVVLQERPEPPKGMSERAEKLFRRIVADNSASQFDVESVTLLRAFCEADNQHYLATQELLTSEAVVEVMTRTGPIKRRNPWFDIQKESSSVMSSLSTKLRAKGVTSDKSKSKPANPRAGLMFGVK